MQLFPVVCVQRGEALRRLQPPHKAALSACVVFLAKHDSSSVSKVASGERSLHQRELQNDLIQAAASAGAETITSDTRRSAFCLVRATERVNKSCFLCVLSVSVEHNWGERLLPCVWELRHNWLHHRAWEDLALSFSLFPSLGFMEMGQWKYLCASSLLVLSGLMTLVSSCVKQLQDKQTSNRELENGSSCLCAFFLEPQCTGAL